MPLRFPVLLCTIEHQVPDYLGEVICISKHQWDQSSHVLRFELLVPGEPSRSSIFSPFRREGVHGEDLCVGSLPLFGWLRHLLLTAFSIVMGFKNESLRFYRVSRGPLRDNHRIARERFQTPENSENHSPNYPSCPGLFP